MKSKNNKKIVILIGDGMADYPIDELGDKTPLEVAFTPNMDYMAKHGVLGLVKTIPEGMSTGSEVANLSVFGYNPVEYFTGRAPLEALGMDIDLGSSDVAFRCNMIRIHDELMQDFTADHIDTEFSRIIINELQNEIGNNETEFYPGVSYRNLLVRRNYPFKEIPETTPPHDILDKQINNYLPKGTGSGELLDIMEKSKKILQESTSIRSCISKYKGKPNAIWLWGGGRKPAIESLGKRFGLYGYTISAVDLIHGIGKAAGLSQIPVEGATGYLDTNYSGKADALLNALEDSNFVYLHVEAPDEAGHEGNYGHKIKAIEDFDKKVVGRVIDGIKDYSNYSILVLPDHPTPLSLRTHTSDPVPFCIYSRRNISGFRIPSGDIAFSERAALETGNYIDKAHMLIEIMLNDGYYHSSF